MKKRDGLAKFAAFVMASPGLLFALLFGVLVVLASFLAGLNWISDGYLHFQSGTKTSLVGTIVAGLYAMFCFSISTNPERMVRAWVSPVDAKPGQ